MSYHIDFTDQAKKDIQLLKKSGNKSSARKMLVFLNELEQHPTTGTGKPEQLKHDLAGLWSRRINKEDRLIYSIDDKNKIVNILSARGHY